MEISMKTPTQVLSCEICKICENTYLHKTILVAASLVNLCIMFYTPYFVVSVIGCIKAQC